MKERPILIAIIGYIIGILWGLYFKVNIALFYFFIIAIYFIYKEVFSYINSKRKFQIISIRRYFRYIKLLIRPNVIFIFIIFSIISNFIITRQEKKLEQIYDKEGELQFIGMVQSQKEEKEYYNRYQVKVIKSGELQELEGKYLYLQVKKENRKEFEYGDIVQIEGEYTKPEKQRNYGGFDYQAYLKTKKIVGIIKTSKIEVIGHKKAGFKEVCNSISLRIKNNMDQVFGEETASILKGLLLGDTSCMEEDLKEDFRIANMSHILAISGMHISYIMIGLTTFLSQKIGKRSTRIVVILVLMSYMFITGASPSVTRASVMGVLVMISGLVYRKNDIWTSLSISLFFILIHNPYAIMNVGLQLSYLGTIGIVIFNSFVSQLLDSIKFKPRKHRKQESKLLEKVKEILAVSISVQIMILPVMLYHFNLFGPYFILSNFLISFMIGPIILLGFVFIIISLLSVSCASLLFPLLEVGIQILVQISKVSDLPFSKIYMPTPDVTIIVVYYVWIVLVKYVYFAHHSESTTTQKRIKNITSLLKYKIRLKKKKCMTVLILLISIVLVFRGIPKELRIYFVDVGQGDCTFIVTPKNQTILVDGGGSELSQYDVGKNILIPYLLDRGYTKIDYIMISHFDRDHVGGILTIMEELQVKNVIFAKQEEDSNNYQEFIELVKEKNIKLRIVEKGNRIRIEDEIYFDLLWPPKKQIEENALNNNSIVAQLVYREFSMLFTGDIEEKAEKEILQDVNSNYLKATVLKVAHHGSKTSTTTEILKEIKPQVALIGVGKNNNFGHPSKETLEKLKNCNSKIYRTDESGEISITVNKKGKIVKIEKLLDRLNS